jgi:hypothetical protein
MKSNTFGRSLSQMPAFCSSSAASPSGFRPYGSLNLTGSDPA